MLSSELDSIFKHLLLPAKKKGFSATNEELWKITQGWIYTGFAKHKGVEYPTFAGHPIQICRQRKNINSL